MDEISGMDEVEAAQEIVENDHYVPFFQYSSIWYRQQYLFHIWFDVIHDHKNVLEFLQLLFWNLGS
jgi:hypothetical protein